jgi:hypothetical protein
MARHADPRAYYNEAEPPPVPAPTRTVPGANDAMRDYAAAVRPQRAGKNTEIDRLRQHLNLLSAATVLLGMVTLIVLASHITGVLH